jgi:hypothetical protein
MKEIEFILRFKVKEDSEVNEIADTLDKMMITKSYTTYSLSSYEVKGTFKKRPKKGFFAANGIVVDRVDSEGNCRRFNSISQAAKESGIANATLAKALKTKIVQFRGFTWVLN